MAKKKTEKKSPPAPQEASIKGGDDKIVSIPVKLNWAPVPVGQFTNHMLVQSDAHTVHLSFFQLQPPIVEGKTPEEKFDALRRVEAINGECVGRVVVSKTQFQTFVEALVTHAEKLKSNNESNIPADTEGNNGEASGE